MKKTLFDIPLEPQLAALPTEPLVAEINFRNSRGVVISTFKIPIYTHVEKRVDWFKMEVNLSYPKS